MDKYNDIRNEYIYLARDREHVLLNNNFYKIGKTKQNGIKKLNNCKSGSELILQLKVNNCDIMEQKIIALFKEKYEIFEGRGTFIGNIKLMKEDIWLLCKEEEGKEKKEEPEKQEGKEDRIKRKNDENQKIISQFISEKIMKTNNLKDKIGKASLQEVFKQWFVITQESRKFPNREELFEYMNEKFGQCKITGWHGVKFVIEDDDELAELEL